MGIFKIAAKIIGVGPSQSTIERKQMGMTREQHDEYCKAKLAQHKAFEDEKLEQDILDWIRTNGYNFVCKTMSKEIVDLVWAKYPDVLSSDGTINPVLEQQTVSKDDNNSLKELELKKQILEMELKLQEMKTQQNK